MTTNRYSCNTSSCLIDITGLCNPSETNDVISQNPYWKQMHVTESLEIPSQKPDIEQLNSLEVSVDILRASVIKTPRSYNDTTTPPTAEPNLEGKLLSGRKLIIEGQICQKVIYTADEAEQPVHSAHFYVPFSSFIVVPETVIFPSPSGADTAVDSLYVNYAVNAAVEDVSACVVDSRRILKKVTLMLSAVPIQFN